MIKQLPFFIVPVVISFLLLLGLWGIFKEKPKEPEIAEELIEVPQICQYPQLPTGCEATAAAMVLQFYGEDISPRKICKPMAGMR